MTTDDLPARLEAVLTERFTELGNPFAAMRRQEKGPDGWPASHPVGPHQVAEVLRELLAAAPVPPPAPTDRAAVERVRAVLETEAVVGRSALDYRGLITSALMADEAQQQPETQATPCSQPNPCEDGGDPCATHEREQAHADGDHGLCGAECTAGQPSLDGALRIVADWYASSEGRDVLIEDLAAAGYQLPDKGPTS